MFASTASGHLQLTSLQRNHELIKSDDSLVFALCDVERELDGFATGPLKGQISDERGAGIVHVVNADTDTLLTIANHTIELRAVVGFNLDRQHGRAVVHGQGPLEEQGAGSGTDLSSTSSRSLPCSSVRVVV